MSEEKFSKCEERGEKKVSVKFRVFGKKNENERKVPEKKSKCFWVEFFFGVKVVILEKKKN